jgi:hypothetical protein
VSCGREIVPGAPPDTGYSLENKNSFYNEKKKMKIYQSRSTPSKPYF